ncbi:MAG: AzlD domain-containing protein [Thermomicrobiales bacterium]
MNALGPILAMAVGMYALRITGFLLADTAIPPAWERALTFVPVATLTALIVTSLAGRADEAPIRLIAAAGAGVVAQRTRRMWACILSGLALYWLLRLAAARIG